MDEKHQIYFMQIRMIRAASERWKKTPDEAAEIMDKYKVFDYISEGFGIFHVEGDEAVLDDIEKYLSDKGVKI